MATNRESLCSSKNTIPNTNVDNVDVLGDRWETAHETSPRRKDVSKIKTFARLVRNGEKATVDFKIECEALRASNPRKVQANAELLKDLCAMANNGSVASYIIIGVSDNGREFKSILNRQLTSDNLQRLIQELLHPIPKIQVYDRIWRRAPLRMRGKRMVVIQIGPNPRKPSGFARDLIDWTAKICFRRNEVWVRNGATTDVATPEQVGFLLKQTSSAPALELDDNVEYQKLVRNQQSTAILNDLIGVLKELKIPTFPVRDAERQPGGHHYPDDFCALLTIRTRPFLFRFAIRAGFSRHAARIEFTRSTVGISNTALSFCHCKTLLRMCSHLPSVHYKEQWGFFTIYHAKAGRFLKESNTQ